MRKIELRSERNGTHAVAQGEEILVQGLSRDEAENYVTFLKAAAKARRLHRLPVLSAI
jgi:hypothetical protein